MSKRGKFDEKDQPLCPGGHRWTLRDIPPLYPGDSVTFGPEPPPKSALNTDDPFVQAILAPILEWGGQPSAEQMVVVRDLEEKYADQGLTGLTQYLSEYDFPGLRTDHEEIKEGMRVLSDVETKIREPSDIDRKIAEQYELQAKMEDDIPDKMLDELLNADDGMSSVNHSQKPIKDPVLRKLATDSVAKGKQKIATETPMGEDGVATVTAALAKVSTTDYDGDDEGEPVPPRVEDIVACAFCLQKERPTLPCDRCFAVSYCGAACKKKHHAHKLVCDVIRLKVACETREASRLHDIVTGARTAEQVMDDIEKKESVAEGETELEACSLYVAPGHHGNECKSFFKNLLKKYPRLQSQIVFTATTPGFAEKRKTAGAAIVLVHVDADIIRKKKHIASLGVHEFLKINPDNPEYVKLALDCKPKDVAVHAIEDGKRYFIVLEDVLPAPAPAANESIAEEDEGEEKAGAKAGGGESMQAEAAGQSTEHRVETLV